MTLDFSPLSVLFLLLTLEIEMSLRELSSVPLISETVDSIKSFDIAAVLKASAALSSGKLPS